MRFGAYSYLHTLYSASYPLLPPPPQEAGMNGSLPVFAASGVFSAMTATHEAGLERLRAAAAGSHGLYRARDFLSRADLRGLHSEARSLVDFLVVLHSQVSLLYPKP